MSYGYIEDYLGMGQPETTGGKLGVMAAQFALGALAAGAVFQQDWKKAAPYGGVAAVAACYLVDTAIPMTGALYWARALLMIPGGVGALVGLYHKKQLESEALSTISWVRQLSTGRE